MKRSSTSIIFMIVLLLLEITLSQPNLSWLKKKEPKPKCKENPSYCLYNSECCSNYCVTYKSNRGNSCQKKR